LFKNGAQHGPKGCLKLTDGRVIRTGWENGLKHGNAVISRIQRGEISRGEYNKDIYFPIKKTVKLTDDYIYCDIINQVICLGLAVFFFALAI
jgi:hypothetical protein